MKEQKKKQPGPLDARPLAETKPSPVKAESGGQQLLSRLQAAEAGALPREYLSHPANAEPVADLLNHLQQSHGNNYVQRLVSEMAKDGSGQGLEASTKTEMEAAFNEDFSQVRVHTGAEAERATEAVNARAMTRGQDIYFNQGEHDPSSPAGREVLAHELAHVAQQRNADSLTPSLTVGSAGDAHEHEADRAAAAVLAGQHAKVTGRASAPAIQRQTRPAQSAPTITRHPQEIAPHPEHGAISVGGVSVAYHYLIAPNAVFNTLTLAVPAGMTVSVTPLTDLGSSDFRVTDPGGTGARAIVISVSAHMRVMPRVQVTLSRENTVYLAIFQFPPAAASAPTSTSAPSPPGKP